MENQPSHDDFNDFGALLAADAAAEAHKSAVDKHTPAVITHIDTLLAKHNVPTDFRCATTQDEQEVLTDTRWKALYLQLTGEPGWRDDWFNDPALEDLFDTTDELLENDRAMAIDLVESVFNLTMRARIEGSLPPDDKKRLMAACVVHNELDSEGAWMNFIREAVPGDSLDFTSDEGERFIAEEMAKIPKHQQVDNIFENAFYGLHSPEEYTAPAYECFLQSTRPLLTDIDLSRPLDHPHTNAKIDEIARESGFAPNQLRTLFAQLHPHLVSSDD